MSVTAIAQEAVPPIGLAYVAAAVRAAGFGVTVIDAVGEALGTHSVWTVDPPYMLRGLAFADVVSRIPAGTRVVGVSCMFSTAWLPVRALLWRIRQAHPGVVIVLGGEHATACAERVLAECPAVDACVLGEGEQTFTQLLRAVDEGAPMATVAAVLTRGGPPAPRTLPRIDDLDTIARPAWDLFPLERYVEGNYHYGVVRGRSMPVLASRGCPFSCTFCSSPRMWTTQWSARDPGDLLDEMRGYIERYRVNDFTFFDLTAIVKRDWILDFARRLIDSGLEITWQLPSGTRSEAIDREVAALMFRSGCRNMNYAPESGSPAVLKRIKKRVKLDRMCASIEAATEVGIEVKVNVILGFPGETLAEVRETIAFVRRLARIGVEAVSIFPFSPYPGSELFDELVRAGRLRVDDGYWAGLVFTDLGQMTSYDEHFSTRRLQALIFAAYGAFYGTQLTVNPRRLLGSAAQLATGAGSGKLANALGPLRVRRAAWQRLRSAGPVAEG